MATGTTRSAIPMRKKGVDAFAPLCIGRHDDPAGHLPIAIKYRVNEIDNVCELGFEHPRFYRHSLI
jgi:hypothetical protein